MQYSEKYLTELRSDCLYSDEGGFDNEGNDLGSVDALIEYKNALEDRFADLLDGLAVAVGQDEVDEDEDSDGVLSGSAADQCAAVYELLGRFGVAIA